MEKKENNNLLNVPEMQELLPPPEPGLEDTAKEAEETQQSGQDTTEEAEKNKEEAKRPKSRRLMSRMAVQPKEVKDEKSYPEAPYFYGANGSDTVVLSSGALQYTVG